VAYPFGRAQPHAARLGIAMILPCVDRTQRQHADQQDVATGAWWDPRDKSPGVSVGSLTLLMNSASRPCRTMCPRSLRFAPGFCVPSLARAISRRPALRRRASQPSIELLIDSLALDCGIHVEGVEIKDVALPEGMKRSASRLAEAKRERRARVATADGEVHSPQGAWRRLWRSWPTQQQWRVTGGSTRAQPYLAGGRATGRIEG
jgi:hypothetical protein